MGSQFLLKKKRVIVFWFTYWVIQSLLMGGGEYLEFYLVKNIVIVGLQFVIVIINFKFLLPSLFEKKKFIHYIVSSIFLIYIIYSFSFVLIGIMPSIYFPDIKKIGGSIIFSFDFWHILSGSSFYSLALICSTTYKLMKKNKGLKTQLKASEKPQKKTL